MRLITTRIHAVIDYTIGTLLIVSPWLFGFAQFGPETWVPVVLGASMLAYSLVSQYEFGVLGIIHLQGHLTLDGMFGLFLMASPLLFAFTDIVWVPHLVLGLLLFIVSLTTRPVATSAPPPLEAPRARQHPRPR